MPIKPRKRPIKVVEETISKNPHLEHSFIKRSRCEIEDVTRDNTPTETYFDKKKMIEYELKTLIMGGSLYTIHTHPKTNISDMLPSIIDIVPSERSNVIYVHEGKKIGGQVHFNLKKKARSSFENFTKKINKTRNQLRELGIGGRNHVASEVQKHFEHEAYRVDLVNELLSRETGRNYFKGQKATLQSTRYNSEFMDFCLRNRLFNPDEIINYFKYKHLFFDNKKTMEMYELLGIQFRFVPNKFDGYRFDPKTVDFIKK